MLPLPRQVLSATGGLCNGTLRQVGAKFVFALLSALFRPCNQKPRQGGGVNWRTGCAGRSLGGEGEISASHHQCLIFSGSLKYVSIDALFLARGCLSDKIRKWCRFDRLWLSQKYEHGHLPLNLLDQACTIIFFRHMEVNLFNVCLIDLV